MKNTIYKLIKTEHGETEEICRGTIEQIVDYLMKQDIFSWILEKEPDFELPELDAVETFDDLQHELDKADFSWWTLTVGGQNND